MNYLDTLIEWTKHLPPSGLYLVVFAWLFIESVGFPLSDEPLLLLAGLLATQNHVNLFSIIVIALIGKVAASCVAYWIGMHFDLNRLARPAQVPTTRIGQLIYHFRPTPEALDSVEERFRRQGAWGVFLGRLIPVVRSFISYPAGAARMPFSMFFIATTAGSLIWIASWTILGAVLGKSASKVTGPLSAIFFGGAVVVLVAVYIWNHFRQERATKQVAVAKTGLPPTVGSTLATPITPQGLKQPSNGTLPPVKRPLHSSSPISKPQKRP